MVRKFIIDDNYRKEISEYTVWDKTTVDTSLINHARNVDRIVTDIYKLKKELTIAKKEYKLLYNKKYYYYTYDSDEVADTETEKKHMIEKDEEIIEITSIVSDIENDIEFLTNFKDALRDKGFNIKNFIDWQNFLAGK